MGITKLPKIGHIGIVVKDVEKAIDELRALYDSPGLDKSKIFSYRPQKVKAWGREVKDAEIRICVADWYDGMRMEILQFVSGEIEHDRFVRDTGGGIHHIQHMVKEYEEYCAFMLERGGVPTFEAEAEDNRGYRRCTYFRMPATNAVIEIAEIFRFRDASGKLMD